MFEGLVSPSYSLLGRWQQCKPTSSSKGVSGCTASFFHRWHSHLGPLWYWSASPMPLGKLLDLTLIPQRRLRGKNRKGTVCLRCERKPGLGGYPNTILVPSPIFFSAAEIAVIAEFLHMPRFYACV